MSKIVVLEGADRCGKATQSAMLRDYIESTGNKAVVVEVPIKDDHTYRLIYWMLGNGLAKKFPKIFQGLQCLNRWIFQTFKLVRLEHDNDYVIFDRWSLSTTVYGLAEGISKNFVDKMYRRLRKPDYTLLLTGKPHHHVAEDVYERDTTLQDKVRGLYNEWSRENPGESKIVQSEKSKIEVHTEIVQTLKENKVLT